MSLRVELEALWNRIAERFKARTEVPYDEVDEGKYVELKKSIQPITNVDEVAREFDVQDLGNVARLAASGAGSTSGITVTAGERWYIRALRFARQAGDGTLTEMNIWRGSEVLAIQVITAAASPNSEILAQDAVLEEGMQVAAYVNAISTDSNWDVTALIARDKVKAGRV